MFVNVVNKHFFFFFILFDLLAQWEGEMNICDYWPSKRIPLKVMRVALNMKDGEMQGEIGEENSIN
jgi:hypothetical protein